MKPYFLLALAILLVACEPADDGIHGYVEGEFVMVAPTSAGILETLSVKRGEDVDAGAPLFALDLTDLTAQRDRAAADLWRAQAELEDLTKGERPEEIDVLLQQREQARATLINAEKEYDRILPLSKTGAVTIARRDEARAARDTARARVDEVEAQLRLANLGARVDRIEAARAAVKSAENLLAQAEKRLNEAAPVATADSTVEDTFFRAGEFIAAGQPVVSLLPPENIKVRFYVPQAIVPQIKHGQSVSISCDGCSGTIAGKVSYIAPQSEYTPPVIFSVESREKLVFLIEATPDTYHSELRPGLPVDIELGQPS